MIRRKFTTVIILLPLLCHGATALDAYNIDWTAVPAAGTAPASKNLTANCICDVTAYACDLECCCDPDCIPPVVNSTNKAGRCATEGPPDQTLDYCVASSIVSRVNLPSSGDFYDVKVQAADNKFFDQLLCIKSSSNPALGDSYPDPPAGIANNNAADTLAPPLLPSPVAPSTYVYNTPVYVSVGGVTRQLTVPYPALSMDCNIDQYTVGFMANLPTNKKDQYSSCTRSVYDTTAATSLLPSLCGATSTDSLTLASLTQLSFLTTPSATTTTPVTIVSIEKEDSTTGIRTALPTTAATSYAANTCTNAVLYASIVVYYNWQVDTTTGNPDGLGTISQISVSAVVTDIPDTTRTVKQSVRVEFVQYQTADTRVLQAFSGNPGYQIGYPVLAGTLASQGNVTLGQVVKTAIQRYTNGMPVLAPGSDGSCSAAATTSIKFGMNTTSTCNIAMDATALQNFCQGQANNAQYQLATLMPEMLPTILNNSLYLGIWGNSDYTDTTQWVQVQLSNYPFNSMLYQSDRSCSNVIVGWDLQILTGVAFSANNLQNKVLYANLAFRTTKWKIPDSWPNNRVQQFQMTSTVSYISKNQVKQTGQKRPAPPLITPLPEEIFYPFLQSSSSQTFPDRAWLLLMICSMLLSLILGMTQLY